MIDFWAVEEDSKVLLFLGAKPEKLNDKWKTLNGPIGELPLKQFPPNHYSEPIHFRLVEVDKKKPLQVKTNLKTEKKTKE
jgi:hypothetical protein